MTTAFSKYTHEQQTQMIDHLLEGNGSVDLAHQLLERMTKDELDGILKDDEAAQPGS